MLARESNRFAAPHIDRGHPEPFPEAQRELEEIGKLAILNDMLYQDRITYDPQQCGGKPCIRGMRVRVKDILEMLAGGMTESEILNDYDYLEREDIRAALEYASIQADHPVLKVS